MCFSAPVSFTAAVVLLGLGAATIRWAPRGPGGAFAFVPLLFGMQQALEGALWLAVDGTVGGTRSLTYGYVMFSHVLWPAFIPLAVLGAETDRRRRLPLLALAAVGLAVAVYFATAIVVNGTTASPLEGRIDYDIPDPWPMAATFGYLAAALGSLLVSGQRWVRAFGVACVLAAAVTYAVAAYAFASVWCFFAAALSTGLAARFMRARPTAQRNVA